jgi:biopolymer transport protein ExbB
MFRTILKSMTALAVISLASMALAQQPAGVPAPPTPAVAGTPATPAVPPSAAASSLPAPAATETPGASAPSASIPSASPSSASPSGASSDGAARALKSAVPGMRELSPWSMFMSADIVVKGVIVGLVFASLATWTIAIAKLIELSALRRRLRQALRRIGEARSLAEAQLAIGGRDGVLASLLNVAMREARLSGGISSDSGIKERAATSFGEILRAEARRVRLGMGVLATIGATAPFVGLFGTVWGIMNSFIGISKSQTTNLAVVAPGIAEALLATAVGLAAAIPAVIIYNHFSRVTKGYLELVSRASGAAARLLSRDLDRSHGGVHARAAE